MELYLEKKINNQLQQKPFYLTDKQLDWVNETYGKMTLDEKVEQIMCPSAGNFNDQMIEQFTKVHKFGGFMIRPLPLKGLQDFHRKIQASSEIPMLISANLENGGSGAIEEGTNFGMPMGCTATGELENGYRLGKVSCQEASSVGVNWGFAPIVDIDLNYRNSITNIRAFSSDPNMVIEMARGYIKAASETEITPTIKHFPGDGTDERDQHLLVSVNQLNSEEWWDTYGKVYQTLIGEGASSIMAGHIAQPAIIRALDSTVSPEEAYLPASLSKKLLTDVLRKKMNYNGMIVTDSTLMNGFMVKMPRSKAIPTAIEAGCDMILFNRNIEEDIRYLKNGIAEGTLSENRLAEAVKRVLALKASKRLVEKKESGTLVPTVDSDKIISNAITKEWVNECADKSVTLVKNKQSVLPLSVSKTKRIYLNVIEGKVNEPSPFSLNIKHRLEKEGFQVTLRKRKMDINPAEIFSDNPSPEFLAVMGEIMGDTDSFVSQYDLAMILLNLEAVSNVTTIRVNWEMLYGLGNDIPWYAGELPLVVVSTANPYHLLDIPMAHAYINAYTGSPVILDAVFEKMMGRSEFKGISPVDPFCGNEDCAL